ncbi:MAG: aldolase/citrate lyase family protein [Desulfobacteraceae bacterium]|jgi:4-hydroxy-2-oxoheptanedioate aldolase
MISQNRMKRALREGNIVFGPMVSEIRSPGIAVLFAQAGFDFFFIDMEHSCFSFETVADMILAARAAGIPAIVRPSSRKSHASLSKPLDSGASGLLVPQVQTRQEAENVVKWCRYQPLGERGIALARQHTFFQGGDTLETMGQLNEEILIALQIEHRDAIERLPGLLSVPGIDAAFVGPADLSASLGKPGQSNDPEVEKAIRSVIQVSEANGVIPGIHTSSIEKAKYWIDQGMKMIGFNTDIKLILQVCKTAVQELRSFV